MEVLILFNGYIFANIITVIFSIILICLNNPRANSGLLIVIFEVAVRVLIVVSALRLPHIALLLWHEALVSNNLFTYAIFIFIIISTFLIFVLLR